MSIIARGIKLLSQVLAGQEVTRPEVVRSVVSRRDEVSGGFESGAERAVFCRVRSKLSKSRCRGLRRVLLYGVGRVFSRRGIGPDWFQIAFGMAVAPAGSGGVGGRFAAKEALSRTSCRHGFTGF